MKMQEKVRLTMGENARKSKGENGLKWKTKVRLKMGENVKKM